MFQQPTDVPYQVQVCNPQKQTDKSRAYVAYTLKVRKVKDGVESSSFRRFSDFLWIHDQLEQKHPTCVIPPMPEKSLSLCFFFFFEESMVSSFVTVFFFCFDVFEKQLGSFLRSF